MVWLAYLMLDARQCWNGGGLLYQGVPGSAIEPHLEILHSLETHSPRRVSLRIRNEPPSGGNRDEWTPRIDIDRGESDDQVLARMGQDYPPSSTFQELILVSHDSGEVGHNIALVRLKPPEVRMSRTSTLADTGFITGYNPLTGQNLCDEEHGRYYVYSAGGRLSPQGGPVTSNFFTFEQAPSDREGVFYVAAIRPQSIEDRYTGSSPPYPPLFIYRINDRLPDRQQVELLYRERAVPFPTMREAHQIYGFPTFSGSPPAHITATGAPRETIRLNANREVEDAGSELLMGDVVEFPLHKFLYACGLARYRDLDFDPEGSFLQGNSVRTRGSSGSEPSSSGSSPGAQLHENIVAMRFQLLLSLAQGSFWSSREVGQRRGGLSWSASA